MAVLFAFLYNLFISARWNAGKNAPRLKPFRRLPTGWKCRFRNCWTLILIRKWRKKTLFTASRLLWMGCRRNKWSKLHKSWRKSPILHRNRLDSSAGKRKAGQCFCPVFLFFRQNFYSSILFEKLKWYNISIKWNKTVLQSMELLLTFILRQFIIDMIPSFYTERKNANEQ